MAGDVRVEALLFQREAFEMLKGVFLGCAAILYMTVLAWDGGID